jgi:predicted GH43/DUF377 family glycosyl hydrolase
MISTPYRLTATFKGATGSAFLFFHLLVVPSFAEPLRPLVDARYPVVVDDWPVEVGSQHQLFVDDEIVANMPGVRRIVEPARKHPANPIIRPEHPWEDDMVLLYGSVLHDQKTNKWHMWYLARNFEDKNPFRTVVCYAQSKDGVTWQKPILGRIEYQGSRENNIVLLNHGQGLDTVIVLAEWHYRMFVYQFQSEGHTEGIYHYTSRDGLEWDANVRPILVGAPVWPKNADGQFRDDVMVNGIGDVTYIRYDQRLQRYLANLKTLSGPLRCRMLSESNDLVHWSRPRVILRPDHHDAGAQLYGMTDFAYESLWLGVVQRYMATTDLRLDLTWAVSHDARHWSRVEPRGPFISGGEEGTWDYGNVSPANNPPIRVGDELWFYYGGRDTTHNTRPVIGAIGLATLPIDRFVALQSTGKGEVLTRPISFPPGTLHVNANAKGGSLRIEVIDLQGNSIAGYDRSSNHALTTDSLNHVVQWDAASKLTPNSEPIRLRFLLNDAKLYSFWFE